MSICSLFVLEMAFSTMHLATSPTRKAFLRLTDSQQKAVMQNILAEALGDGMHYFGRWCVHGHCARSFSMFRLGYGM